MSTAQLPHGQRWQATAECVSIEGRVLGSAVALARREEPGKGSMSDHALTATAQTRARRNALRSVLGWIPRMGGLDVADPGAPVTREQVRALWAVSHERGWDRARIHQLAGVESLNDLTREQAGERLEAWCGPAEPPPDDDQPAPVAPAGDTHPPHRWIDPSRLRRSAHTRRSRPHDGPERVARGTPAPDAPRRRDRVVRGTGRGPQRHRRGVGSER